MRTKALFIPFWLVAHKRTAGREEVTSKRGAGILVPSEAEMLFPVGHGGRWKVLSFKNGVCSGAKEACLE